MWRLDRYPLEYLFTLPQKSRLLLPVAVYANNCLLSGLGENVEEQQSNGRITLSGWEYYRLKCSIGDTHFNQLVS